MASRFLDRLSHGWNIFANLNKNDQIHYNYHDYGLASVYRPDLTRFNVETERSILAGIKNQIVIDIASANIRHVRLDSNKRYLEEINSRLNNCLSVEANIDQSGTQLLMDIAITMLEEGVAAIVPIDTTDTTFNPRDTNSYDINDIRVGVIKEWMPEHVRVSVYNQKSGKREEVVLPKNMVAIAENPFRLVMNEPNSILKRLSEKINLMDSVDKQVGSGKLDLIIQLPYVIKTETRKAQAEERRRSIENQLAESLYGIAYTDGTEHITQLNRPVENNMLNQVKYLTDQLYDHLGVTAEVISGTASPEVMTNYYSRTINPILKAIVDAMQRKFLTKTARSQGQAIIFYRDPFQLVPVTSLATIADTFTRNAILSSNDVRAIMGYKPSEDPSANQLINKNMPADKTPQGILPASDPNATASDSNSQYGNLTLSDIPISQITEGG